ncbi:unnamed protein product [Cuscuta campestris]|uniref:SHSP domain-containing protein n=1 Tax=Cuscuta campestris TaxID=132261 RepID=A0A484L4Y3_9ASTE|nr:unnamed protein product [Cuscuta campestris]
MAQKAYEDFIPKSEVLGETDATAPTVINIYLPGFKREDLKVSLGQPAKPRRLMMTGVTPIGGGKKWLRFIKEFPISPDCDTGKISAKFDKEILSITLPKKTASVQKPDETKENKESGQGQQAKGQTDTTNSSQQTTKGVDPLEHKPDHDQNPTNGSVQDTKNKKTEEPAAPQVKGKAGISEEEPKPEESKGQTNTTSQASAKVVAHPETREEESSEVGQGGSASEPPPPKPQETNKKAEEQKSGEPASPQVNGEVSKEVPKQEEPKSHVQQAKQLNEVNGAKSETTTDGNEKEEGDTKNAVKRKGYECTFAETKLRKRVKMLNLALAVLAGIGIGLYVKNMIRSYGGEADE